MLRIGIATLTLNRLFALPYSPWSERARWSLNHHQIPYIEHEYQPLLSEPKLRWQTRKWRGPISVPVLITEQSTLLGSMEIAEYAEQVGTGTPLMSPTFAPDIKTWVLQADGIMSAGRAILIHNLMHSKEAMRASLPSWVPPTLRRYGHPVSHWVLKRLGHKYGCFQYRPDDWTKTMRSSLIKWRSVEKPYLNQEFTIAEMSMVLALQFAEPCCSSVIPLHLQTRSCWRHDQLASEFEDLINWRDDMLNLHHKIPETLETSG